MVKVKKSILARIFRRDEGASAPVRGPAVNVASDRVGSRPTGRVNRPPESSIAVAPGANRTASKARHPVTAEEEVVVAPQPVRPPPVPPVAKEVAKGMAESNQVLTSAMGKQEELNLALKQGFEGITDVLDGLDRKIDKHQRTSDEIMISVRQIPEIMKGSPDSSQVGVELLARISSVLETQGKSTQELLAQMSKLPGTIEALQGGLVQQVAEIAQGHKNVDKTMHETQRQLSNAFTEMQKKVGDVATDQSRKQEQVLKEMRTQQARQDQRVEELLNRSNGAIKLIVFLLVVSIAALLLVVNQIGH